MKKEDVKSIIDRTEIQILPDKELQHLLLDCSKSKLSRYVMAAFCDHKNNELVLFRANDDKAVIPFSWIEPNGIHSPNFYDLEVSEYGNTIRLGEYEASSYSLLRDFDSVKKLKPYNKCIDYLIDYNINAAVNENGSKFWVANFVKEKRSSNILPNVEIILQDRNVYKSIGIGHLIHYYDGWSINSGLDIPNAPTDIHQKLGKMLFRKLVLTKEDYNV